MIHFYLLLNRMQQLLFLTAQRQLQDADKDQRPVIQVNPDEKAAIDRLSAMGYSQEMAVEAYMVCGKNEELAAQYLLDNAGFSQRQQPAPKNEENKQKEENKQNEVINKDELLKEKKNDDELKIDKKGNDLYDEGMVNGLVQVGLGTKKEVIAAILLVDDKSNIDDIVNKILELKSLQSPSNLKSVSTFTFSCLCILTEIECNKRKSKERMMQNRSIRQLSQVRKL